MARGEGSSWGSWGRSKSESPPPPYSQVVDGGHRAYERTPLLNSVYSKDGNKSRSSSSLWELVEYIARVFAALAIVAVLIGAVGFLGYFLLSFIRYLFRPAPPPPTFSVAIIGAGPAGIAAAQQLRASTPQRDFRIDITIFETSSRVGGQLAVANPQGGLVFPHDDPLQDPITAEDTAGSALLYANPLFTRDSENILGDRVSFTQLETHQVKYYRGENSVTETTRPYSKTPMMAWLGLIFRYGPAVWRFGGMTKDEDFRNKIAKAPLSTDIREIVESLGVINLAQQWATNELGHRGIGGSYRTEVVEPQIRRTLGQRLEEVSGLALLIATVQEDMGSSFSGGDLAERLESVLYGLNVDLRTETKVTGFKYELLGENQPAWIVQHEGMAGTTSPQYAAFDKIILATYDDELIREAMFGIRQYDQDAEEMIESVSGLFKPAYLTFFTSTKQSETWHSAEQFLFLDTDDKESFYSSVHEFALVRAIPNTWDDNGKFQVEYLYRLLSDSDVTEHLQQDPAVTWMHQERIENAYPLLLPVNRFPQFKVPGHSLWWTSVINSIGNSIDLNWLAGKIVAQDLIREVKMEQMKR
ncbi:hypothetical protein F4810DRAFT_489150 [Camillea tinctor]|nr:hypothetical protein F4810DRAFT_489150 [Camillea tinctor]